jgi:hypothetical protein
MGSIEREDEKESKDQGFARQIAYGLVELSGEFSLPGFAGSVEESLEAAFGAFSSPSFEAGD